MFLRRLGPAPEGNLCAGGRTCPDIFELTSGDFALIGSDITEKAAGLLPSDAGCGPGERIISVPRRILVMARNDIPSSI